MKLDTISEENLDEIVKKLKKDLNEYNIQKGAIKFTTKKLIDHDVTSYNDIFNFFKEDTRREVSIGAYYLSKEKITIAKKHYKKALEINPNNSDANLGLSICYESQGKKSLSEKYKKRTEIKAEKIPKESDELQQSKEDDEIGEIKIFKKIGKGIKSLFAETSAKSSAIDTGQYLLEQKYYSAAETYFEEVLKSEPNNIDVIQSLAYCSLMQERFSEAKDYCEKALQIDQNDSYIRDILEHLENNTKDSDESKEEFLELSDDDEFEEVDDKVSENSSGLSNKELLRKLEERLALGEISEDTYLELKKKYDNKIILE